MLAILQDTNKFWGQYVCPCLTRDDMYFPQQQYWRGDIWPPANYLIFQGLKNYASADLQRDFARKSVALFMLNWNQYGYSCENFYTTTGAGGGDPHLTWGPLMCLIGVEALCDVDPSGQVHLDPAPTDTLAISRLPIGGISYDVSAANGQTTMAVSQSGAWRGRRVFERRSSHHQRGYCDGHCGRAVQLHDHNSGQRDRDFLRQQSAARSDFDGRHHLRDADCRRRRRHPSGCDQRRRNHDPDGDSGNR